MALIRQPNHNPGRYLPGFCLSNRAITIGFLVAAAYNIAGMLIVTRAFTSETFFNVDPQLFSRPGCLLVMIWGLVFAAQSRCWKRAWQVSAALVVEKLFYVGWWVAWLVPRTAGLGDLWDADPLSGFFFSAYGLGDALFAALFALAAYRGSREGRRPAL
jgi:hypothetical protein